MSGNISDLQGQGSRVRTPLFEVYVSNVLLTGVIGIETANTSHFAADTFRVTAAISDLPADLNINYWDKSFGDELEVREGSRPTSLCRSSFTGKWMTSILI